MHGSIISNVISGYTGGLAGSTNKAPQDVTAPNDTPNDSDTSASLVTPTDFSLQDAGAARAKAHFADDGSDTQPTIAANPWTQVSTYTPAGLMKQGLSAIGSTGSLQGDVQKLFSTNGDTAGGEF